MGVEQRTRIRVHASAERLVRRFESGSAPFPYARQTRFQRRDWKSEHPRSSSASYTLPGRLALQEHVSNADPCPLPKRRHGIPVVDCAARLCAVRQIQQLEEMEPQGYPESVGILRG